MPRFFSPRTQEHPMKLMGSTFKTDQIKCLFLIIQPLLLLPQILQLVVGYCQTVFFNKKLFRLKSVFEVEVIFKN